MDGCARLILVAALVGACSSRTTNEPSSGGGAGGFGASGGSGGGTGGAALGGVGGAGGPDCSGSVAPQGTIPPSCKYEAPGTGKNCGLSNDADCCASFLVHGGTFPMGRSLAGADSTTNGELDEAPEHEVTVADFKLDRFEVTVGRFRKFVEAGGGTQASPPAPGTGKDPNLAPSDSGWQPAWSTHLATDTASLGQALGGCLGQPTWTAVAGSDDEKRPINCVTWYEAEAFCAWDDGWLPSEAEWEYAAAGGSDNRLYPWSNPPSSNTVGSTYAVYESTTVSLVGSKPEGDGKYCQADLNGSMDEWNLDWYKANWYSEIGSTCVNCANTASGTERVKRSGAWNNTAMWLRAANRNSAEPSVRYDYIGFRCARAAP